MKSVNWVNAQRFDPEARDGGEWTDLAALLAGILDGNADKPLSVPIDPAAVVISRETRDRPWGLAEALRLKAALSLLKLVENRDGIAFGRIAARLECIRENGMPDRNKMAVAWVDAHDVAEREKREVNKTDIATKAGLAGVHVPAENKRREWFAKYGMGGVAQLRPARKPRAEK